MQYKQAITHNQIIEIAHRLLHQRGYHSFSYADISEEVGIKKASIHYYYPNKKDLVREVVVRHRKNFKTDLDRIETASTDPITQLDLYVQLFAQVLYHDEQMCICGILAAEYHILPKDVQVEVQGFFNDNIGWLTQVIAKGCSQGILQVEGPVELEATLLFSSIEGLMLVTRTAGGSERFELIVQKLIRRMDNSLNI